MASPVLISEQQQSVAAKPSALSYAKIVVQQHNEIEKPTIGKGNIVNMSETHSQQEKQQPQQKSVSNMRNKSTFVGRGGRGGGRDFPSRQQRYSTSSSDEVVVKNVRESASSSSSQQQIPATQDTKDQEDMSGEFETVVGKRHGHSNNSMKYRDNNNVVSGRGKYNNNYRRYRDRRPIHENHNTEKSITPPTSSSQQNNHTQKVVTNGSVCSETSSNSSTDGRLASILSDEVGHGSVSNSIESAGENETGENGEAPKVKYIDAPPPTVNAWNRVNPWQVNSSPSSGIAKVPPKSSLVKKDERTLTGVSSPVVVGTQTFADLVSHEPGSNKMKGRRYPPPGKQVEKVSGDEDWPALHEVTQVTSTPPKSVGDVRLVRFASSATESNDSGSEEVSTSQNPLNTEKWPSISTATSTSLDSKNEESTPTVIMIEIDATNEGKGGTNSRDGDVSGEEPTTEENGNRKNNSKAARPKWVPLSIPETGTTKNNPRSPRRDRPVDKSSKFRHAESSESNNGRPIGRGGGRGRGGSSSTGGRGGRDWIRNGTRYNHHNVHKEPYDHNNSARHGVHREDYTDYPTDFTVLMYPVSEFIMPYVTNNVVPSAFVTSPLTEDPKAGAPYNDRMLTDLVKTQIEYYFSEENLGKDFYLRRKMDSDGYLPVGLISSFHRVKNMTEDYGLVLAAINSSTKLELSEDKNFVRTVTDPTKWPILDSTMPLPLFHSTFMMPMSSGILIPLPTGEFTTNITSSRLSGESTGEMLNPNVPEFYPKSYLATSSSEDHQRQQEALRMVQGDVRRNPIEFRNTAQSQSAAQAEVHSSSCKEEKTEESNAANITLPKMPNFVKTQQNANEEDELEAWQRVQRRPRPSTSGKNYTSETSVDELAFQFDEELTLSTRQQQINYSSSRHNLNDNVEDPEEMSNKEIDNTVIFTQKSTTETVQQASSIPIQTRPLKHDRTGDGTTKIKMTQDLAKIIDDGLKYYEDNLWVDGEGDSRSKQLCNANMISNDDFDKVTPPLPS